MAGKALAPAKRVVLFAHVGNDDAGAWIRRTLDEKQVQMPLEPLVEFPTSESYIISESEHNGRGTIFSVPGARACELPLEAIQATLADAQAFCLCAPSNNQQILPLLDAARAAGVPSYFALGGAQIYKLGYDELQEQLGAGVALVICNRSEAAKLTGTKDVKAQLSALRFGGLVATSVVTCGDEGLWGLDKMGMCYEPAYRDSMRPVLDDTGAGDATAAAIVDSLLRGLSLQDALACGARNGFEACTAFGLENVCARAEMDAFLESRHRKAA
jgi:sugar/nucleoside kinase (ribokinase family)